jgi:hypothetical protein
MGNRRWLAASWVKIGKNMKEESELMIYLELADLLIML